jgi:myo-inositol-hexaphosphate 3-phosphohydrolase
MIVNEILDDSTIIIAINELSIYSLDLQHFLKLDDCYPIVFRHVCLVKQLESVDTLACQVRDYLVSLIKVATHSN